MKRIQLPKAAKFWSAALLLAAVIVVPTLADVALAAGGGGDHGGAHAVSIGTLAYPALNFIIFVGILVFAYRKAGKAKLVELHTDVKEHLKRAAEDLGAAESVFNRAQQRLDRIEDEKRTLIAALNQEGKETAEQLLAKAEVAVENSLLDTKRRIDNEVASAESELRREVVRRATVMAREKVVGRLSGDDDARLRREAIQRIG